MRDAEPHDRFRPEAGDGFTVEQDFAGGRLGETRDGAERGGLAGPVGAEQGHDLTCIDADRDAAQRLDFPVADHQIANVEQRHYSVPR